MRLSPYEKNVQREIEKWHHQDASLVVQALSWAAKPLDWAVERVSPDLIDQAGKAVSDFLSMLSDASEWTYDYKDLLETARKRGLDIQDVEDLREQPMEERDALARAHFTQNAVLAAVEGGGAGLGGVFFIAADIPLLFTVNFRLIQQIGASFGYPMRGPAYRPLVLAIFNASSSGSREARNDALREVSVAAAAFASNLEYKGRVSGTLRDQNRHFPREIAKNILGRKLMQAIPIAGAAVGAGVNYWFTMQTAEAAYMLFRALSLEAKERE
ncbi:MAG TPA: EcsC family protein [Rhodothermales bacterium]|nr:EcsC family protein [Rhodothermales bacterium]